MIHLLPKKIVRAISDKQYDNKLNKFKIINLTNPNTDKMEIK